MSEQNRIVHVAVATLWTTPESPELIDQPAIASPVDIRGWLNMSLEDRLGLYDKDKVQTQALFGTVVQVVKQEGDWAYVVVPDQPTIKDERGYPGWVPLRQLSPRDGAAMPGKPIAVVTEPTAYLYLDPEHKEMEISYLTQLPVIQDTGDWVQVATPLGNRYLRKSEVAIHQSRIPQAAGQRIVEEAKRFLGLPYLWGGTSAFGYDCSGFAYSIHRACGIAIPRDASNQARSGHLIETDNLLPGDLVFFAFEEGRGRVHHVGIYIGDGQMIHAPKTGKTIEMIPIKGSPYEGEHSISRRYW